MEVRKTAVMIIMSAAVLLSGCGVIQSSGIDKQPGTSTQGTEIPDDRPETLPEVPENVDTTDTPVIRTAETLPTVSTDPAGEQRLMTLEELSAFEHFLNEENGYGFLLSEYASPEYLDLNQVFYNGMGQMSTSLSENEKTAFLAVTGDKEIYTDMTRLTRKQIDEVLRTYAGISLEDVRTRFYWTYIPEFDSYYFEHGDTNQVLFSCTDGTETDGLYLVNCRENRTLESVYRCTVSVKRTESGWQFVANQIVRDGLSIRENQAKEDTTSGIRHIVEIYRRSKGYRGDGYGNPIFNSDMRYYTRKELMELDPKLYAVFRNEIYARHGYVFKDSSWNQFFEDYTWYEGTISGEEFNIEVFNQFEVANLKLVMELEH